MKLLNSIVLIVCSFLILTSVSLGQDNQSVYFDSWSTDNLREQKFNFLLDSSKNVHTGLVSRWNGSGYNLILTRVPAGKRDYELEYWRVELKEILSNKTAKKEKLGCNLLTAEGCGSGGDNFPREDIAHVLFPRENGSRIDLLLRGNYYPIKTKRVIKVKSFYVVVEVNDFKMDGTNPKKLAFMDVSIRFTNTYCPQTNK